MFAGDIHHRTAGSGVVFMILDHITDIVEIALHMLLHQLRLMKEYHGDIVTQFPGLTDREVKHLKSGDFMQHFRKFRLHACPFSRSQNNHRIV